MDETTLAILAVLGKLLGPVGQELGDRLRGWVAWRLNNLQRTSQKATAMIAEQGGVVDEVHVHPRLGITVINHASLTGSSA